MDVKLVCFCAVLVVSLGSVSPQYSNTPCPGVFDFESDGANVFGKIVLRANAPATSLVVKINFTVAVQVFSNYAGHIEAEEGNILLQKYNSGLPVSYRVHFPVTSPLPKLTALTVNGDTICYGPGDSPRPGTYVTTLSLQHTSFLRDGSPIPGMFNFKPQRPHRPQSPSVNAPDPVIHQLIGQLGEDTHVYSFNNIEPTWSTGNTHYYTLNNSGPFTQSTHSYQPPTQPVYQQPDIYDRDPYQDPPFTNQNQFNRPSRPNRPNRPAYEPPPTRPPVYERPVTRPQPRPPAPPEDTYYQDRVSERPIPQRPFNPQPDPSTSTTECGIVAGGNEKIPLIYNGKSYQRGDVPWLVAIYKTEGGTLSFICGGTLVSNRHVVTAAHCMQRRSELSSIKDFVVKVGVHNLNDWSDDITVTRTLISAAIHENFNASTLENDILVFTFNKRVEFNTYIRPACLWSGNTELSWVVGASGVVAGWGDQTVSGAGRQGEPHMVRMPIVSTAVCRASRPTFHKLTSSNTLCAGDRNGAGPCRGDSGGGLYLLDNGKWRLRGVVSVSLRAENGDNTCNLNEYIIFTDTAQYLTWIRSVISENYYD